LGSHNQLFVSADRLICVKCPRGSFGTRTHTVWDWKSVLPKQCSSFIDKPSCVMGLMCLERKSRFLMQQVSMPAASALPARFTPQPQHSRQQNLLRSLSPSSPTISWMEPAVCGWRLCRGLGRRIQRAWIHHGTSSSSKTICMFKDLSDVWCIMHNQGDEPEEHGSITGCLLQNVKS
jgi:hypothetical protein